MHKALKKELKEFERDLSILVARFIHISDVMEATPAETGVPEMMIAPAPPPAPTEVVPRDWLTAYT